MILYLTCMSDIVNQEPIPQREGALNLCRYANSTCCQMALAQHLLYGMYYVSAIIHLQW